jgi:hypothetical protein
VNGTVSERPEAMPGPVARCPLSAGQVSRSRPAQGHRERRRHGHRARRLPTASRVGARLPVRPGRY